MSEPHNETRHLVARRQKFSAITARRKPVGTPVSMAARAGLSTSATARNAVPCKRRRPRPRRRPELNHDSVH